MTITADNEELDLGVINEFCVDLEESREIAEIEIARLDANPDDKDAVNALFRVLHNIKGNSRMCQLDRLGEFAHYLESVIGEIRADRLPYVDEIGEVVMLALDELRVYTEEFARSGEYNEPQLKATEKTLDAIARATPDSLTTCAQAAIARFTGKLPQTAEVVGDAATPIAPGHGHHEDLAFFQDLSARFYARLPYAEGRIERTLPLLQKLNAAAMRPVDPMQLEAALYMHDVGLAFLPDHVLLKDGKFTDAERDQMMEHPGVAADLLARIIGWEVAAQIVAQHHVWMDGMGGYPAYNGTSPHIGAQMLAIVDSYESMTHPRPDRQFRRSVLRAVNEINNCVGTQFSAELVPIFIAVVRDLVSTKTE